MHKRLGLAIFFVLGAYTLINLYFIKDLQFNYNFESFFPTQDPELRYYDQFKAAFETDNDYLLIGIKNDRGIFEASFLKNLEEATGRISVLPEVERISSPLSLKRLIRSPTGFLEIPLIHVDAPSRYASDSARIYGRDNLIGSFFSEDGKSVAIVIHHPPNMLIPQAEPFIQQIENILSEYAFDEVHIAGKVKAQGVYIEKMQKELLIFFSTSVLIVTVILWFTYRSLWGIFVPITVVMLAIIWLLGTMAVFDKSLNILLILMPTILFVVGMSDAVHLLSKYLEELRKGSPKLLAIKVTVKEIGLATFLTSLTTAVGFLTLNTSLIKPIREFGLLTATGVFMAFIIAILLLPSVLYFSGNPNILARQRRKRLWTRFFQRLFSFFLNNYRRIPIAGLVITILAIIGLYKVKVNSYLIEDLPENDPLKQDFIYFDQTFSGSRPFEIMIWIEDSGKSFFDAKVLREMEKITRYLRDEHKIATIVSPVDIVKAFNQGLKGGMQSAYALPDNPSDYNNLKRYLKPIRRIARESKVMNDSATLVRISGKVPDIGSVLSIQKREEIRNFLHDHIDDTLIGFRITGTSVLIDKNSMYLTSNLLKGLAIAFIVVALLAGLMFRSWRMVLISVIPNMIPLIWVAGIMGFAGIDMKLSTSMVFSIAFGIAVDDTIHFLSKLRIELGKGKSLIYAIKRTYFSTGKAIIITTIILIGGFCSLLLSSFGGTFYTGLLVSLTLVFAVVIDLTLLPALLLLLFAGKKKTYL